jgi:hypothetical protein
MPWRISAGSQTGTVTTKINMNGSPPPKPAVIASLVVLVVELPAFIMFLLIRWTPNYGPEWHNWPVLAGLFPALFATDKLNLLPHHLSLPWLRVELTVFTILFMVLLFFISWRTRFWKHVLAVGLAGSSALAVLGLLLLRA